MQNAELRTQNAMSRGLGAASHWRPPFQRFGDTALEAGFPT